MIALYMYNNKGKWVSLYFGGGKNIFNYEVWEKIECFFFFVGFCFFRLMSGIALSFNGQH